MRKKAKQRPSSFATETLRALLWVFIMAAAASALAWHLYYSGPQREREALTDGRAQLIALTEPKAALPDHASSSLADTPDASTFPRKAPSSAAPASLKPAAGQALAPFNPALSEPGADGPVPKPGANGEKPWLAYAHPYARSGSSPVIAILITGVGMSKEASDAAIQLPPEMALGITAYAPQAKLWGDAARALGHEIFIDAPVEPADISLIDLGPRALLTANSAKDNMANLRWVLARAPAAIGIDLPATERFSSTQIAALPIYRFLFDHGLMMALAPGGPATDQDILLSQTTLPYMRADFRLDDALTADDIAHQLAALENLAVRRGYAFGVGRAYPVTLKTVAQWAQQLDKKGIILAPVSALARMKFS